MTRWGVRLFPTHLLIGGLFAFAAVIAGMGLAPNAWILALILPGFGVVVIILQSSFTTLMQHTVSNDLMGRIGSIFTVVMLAANVLSLLLAGILGTLIGIRQVFFLLSALIALWLRCHPHAGEANGVKKRSGMATVNKFPVGHQKGLEGQPEPDPSRGRSQ